MREKCVSNATIIHIERAPYDIKVVVGGQDEWPR